MLGTGARREPNQGYIKTGSGDSYFGAFSVILVLLLCLCVSSWGACRESGDAGSCTSSCRGGGSWSGQCCMSSCNDFTITINGTGANQNCVITKVYNAGCSYGYPTCAYKYVICDTQAEADSVACEANCQSPNQCINGVCTEPPKDSVKVCANETTCELGQGCSTQMGLFKCPDGYTSLTECEPLMLVPGTCSQNGYETGEQPPDSVDYGAKCFASFDGSCYMMDNATGNQFQCDCQDNSCNDAYNQMALGNCKNPYAQSSASSSPSSSVSQSSGSSSPSSSADRPPDSVESPKVDSGGVWNYDYNEILNSINNNVIFLDNSVNNGFGQVHNDLTQMQTTAGQQLMQEEYIRANTQQIASNTDYTNTLIKQSDANRKAENSALIAKYNQMIGEVESIGNTLNSSADVGTLPDTAYNINYDTLSIDTAPLPNIDSLVSMNQAWLDSFQQAVDSINDPDRHDTIGLMEIYDFSDTNEIRQKLSDFFFPGAVSNTCPVLDHTIHWPEPMGDQRWYIDFGNLLGKFDICAFVRWVVRLFTTIAIIFGSFKAVMRAFGGGSDE